MAQIAFPKFSIYRTTRGALRLSVTAQDGRAERSYPLRPADVLALRDDATRVLTGESPTVLNDPGDSVPQSESAE
jgi:hypothetical protein